MVAILWLLTGLVFTLAALRREHKRGGLEDISALGRVLIVIVGMLLGPAAAVLLMLSLMEW